jgi:hypothetical protein
MPFCVPSDHLSKEQSPPNHSLAWRNSGVSSSVQHSAQAGQIGGKGGMRIKSRASRVLGKQSITELHPQAWEGI